MGKWSQRGASLALALVLAGTVGLAGCSKIERSRGYVPDASDLAEITIGQDTRQTVRDSLGSPSTVGTFDDDAWYYIRSRHERMAFFKDQVVAREVVAIYFDDQNHVSDIAHYGLEDGMVVSYSTRKTPTRGRELTILEQLLGNVGRETIPTPQ
jgi:outer membrane protein assembly factor BamE (lipoprotein component of BamABCDE complex)